MAINRPACSGPFFALLARFTLRAALKPIHQQPIYQV
jgi:hypothetical protein